MRVSVPLGGSLGPSAAASDNTAVVWLTPRTGRRVAGRAALAPDHE